MRNKLFGFPILLLLLGQVGLAQHATIHFAEHAHHEHHHENNTDHQSNEKECQVCITAHSLLAVAGDNLVLASLIIPALSTVLVSDNKRLFVGYLIAMVSFIVGLMVSAFYDLPTGPAIVCAYPLCGFLFFLKTVRSK